MKVLVHLYSNKQEIYEEPLLINDALHLMEIQEDIRSEPDNFIGFTYADDEYCCIQFVRYSKSIWQIDIPTYSETRFVGSLSSETVHNNLIGILSEFFNKNSEIGAYLRKREYSQVESIFSNKWKINFNHSSE
ncbi:MAG: hypothetical protein OEY49_16165 [Candidatus Heimdallarchaeota archaeon]|nr:hypothetical protein [Candidatus Heimdallarchaeota archaeon]